MYIYILYIYVYYIHTVIFNRLFEVPIGFSSSTGAQALSSDSPVKLPETSTVATSADPDHADIGWMGRDFHGDLHD